MVLLVVAVTAVGYLLFHEYTLGVIALATVIFGVFRQWHQARIAGTNTRLSK
jgi:hypothetical protein